MKRPSTKAKRRFVWEAVATDNGVPDRKVLFVFGVQSWGRVCAPWAVEPREIGEEISKTWNIFEYIECIVLRI